MTTADAIQLLRQHPHQPALFIADPTHGDRIKINPQPHETIPATAEGHEFSDTDTLLRDLDFTIYDGSGPHVEV